MDEIVKEFLVESHENLNQLDQDLVALEKDPGSPELLGSIFRTIHTIKGISGFLGFSKLEAVAHCGENLLSKLRDQLVVLNADITSGLLTMVDAVRRMLASIEADGNDGEEHYESLIELLAKLENDGDSAPDAVVAPAPQSQRTEPHPDDLEASVEHPPDGSGNASSSHPGREDRNGGAKPSATNGAVAAQESARTAEQGPSAQGEATASGALEANIRVNVSLLDRLMNLVGELVLARNQILQFSARQDGAFLSTSQRLNLITTELQEGIMKTRMQPIGNVWNKFPRLVRDVALVCGKQVRIDMEGEDTDLDKTLIEAIRDPLTHIVRNAIDHGIEPPAVRVAAGKPAEGRLFLRAFHESGQVNIEISDDGAGIDFDRVKEKALERGLITVDQAARLSTNEALNLLFSPGFSTAREVTNVSGRGVGMDVVKTNIEKIGGTVDVQSERGRGTTLKIKIPLTLAIIPALVVTCDGDRYAIPQVSLIELVRLDGDDAGKKIETIRGAPVYRLRGHLLPLVYLSQVLKLDGQSPKGDDRQAAHIVVLQVGERQFGLVVDEVNDTEEIVVKPLGKQLKGVSAFAGATIMGDGRVALILDGLGVAQISGVFAESREAARADEQKSEPRASGDRTRLLLFRAAGSERLAIPLSLVARLEEFPQSQIEHAAGYRVVQYRGKILPLIDLGPLLGTKSSEPRDEQQPMQVVVIGDGDRTIGVEVDRILDIVEEQVSATQQTNRPGLLGSAILGQKVTDFLDLHAVLQAADQSWFANRQADSTSSGTVLLVENQVFSRALLRSYLEMAGLSVIEACDAAEACEKLGCNKVDVVVVSLDLPEEGAFSVLDHVRTGTDDSQPPTLALTGRPEEQAPPANGHPRFDDYQTKFERAAMIRSIEKLMGLSHTQPSAHHNGRTEAEAAA